MSNSLNMDNSESQSLKLGDHIQNPYKQPTLPKLGPGDKIGPNKIQVLIGEGGSANVYKVWHEGLEVVRAVKVLKKYTDKEARERFFTEGKILADIHHPNIVEIHNIGYIDQQIPFLEMEYVDGVSLKNLLEKHKKLPVSVALALAYFVCHALKYTHVKDYTLYGKIYHGLIHRDIKPDNIIVTRDGTVKLMDFGIARPSEVSLHTIGAKIMGTLVYLSPEQLSGKQLDFRSDIFSLGAVLYEMLTGNRAFPQKTLSELVQKKSKGEFRPIETCDPAIPQQIIDIVNKSMALEPDNRYPTSADFGQDMFGVFRTISDRDPQDAISRFMINPSSITRIMTNPLPKQMITSIPEKKKVPVAAIIAGIAIAGIVIIIGLSRLL